MRAFEAPTPVDSRPSDLEREHVVRTLTDEAAAGRLSTDTFAERVELALSTTSSRQLNALLRDLPSGIRGWFLGRVEALSAFIGEVGAHWDEPRVRPLTQM